MKKPMFLILVFAGILIISCSNPTTVQDIDGNIYKTVKIGEQVWMAENLRTTKYRNGDLIGTTTPATKDISGESTPKYQWAPINEESRVATYGRLYTWYAVTDDRNVCPKGWHLPSIAEWATLIDYLTVNGYGNEGSGDDIAKSMAATSGWDSETYEGTVGNNQASNNSSGFTSFPSGYHRWSIAEGFTVSCRWWSSTRDSRFPNSACVCNMFYNNDHVVLSGGNREYGYSVRCLRGRHEK